MTHLRLVGVNVDQDFHSHGSAVVQIHIMPGILAIGVKILQNLLQNLF